MWCRGLHIVRAKSHDRIEDMLQALQPPSHEIYIPATGTQYMIEPIMIRKDTN